MNRYISILLFVLISCNTKKEEKIITQKPKVETKKSFALKYIGEVKSGKSYAFLMTPTMSEYEKEKAFNKVEKGNPTLDYQEQDSNLVSFFKKIGIVKNGQIIFEKFTSKSDSISTYFDSSGNKLQLKFYVNAITKNTHFKLQNSKDKVDVDTGSSPVQKLDYAFIDIISGGNKELVFLDDFHISNNDRFYFKVYEIITNK